MNSIDRLMFALALAAIVGAVLTTIGAVAAGCCWLERHHVRLRVAFQNWLNGRRERRTRRRLRRDVIKDGPSDKCRREYVS